MKYPEHEKLRKIQPESQAIGEFLDWLMIDKHLLLAKFHEHDDSCFKDGHRVCAHCNGDLALHQSPFTKLLAEYFNLDEEALEKEKRMMLQELHND